MILSVIMSVCLNSLKKISVLDGLLWSESDAHGGKCLLSLCDLCIDISVLRRVRKHISIERLHRAEHRDAAAAVTTG